MVSRFYTIIRALPIVPIIIIIIGTIGIIIIVLHQIIFLIEFFKHNS